MNAQNPNLQHKVNYPDLTEFLNACDALSQKMYGKSSLHLVECPDVAVGELNDAFANDLTPLKALGVLLAFDEKYQPENGAELLNKYIRSLGMSDVHHALYEPENNNIVIVCSLPLCMTAQAMKIEGLCAEYRIQLLNDSIVCFARYCDAAGEDINACISESDKQLIKTSYLKRIAIIESLAKSHGVVLGMIDKDNINSEESQNPTVIFAKHTITNSLNDNALSQWQEFSSVTDLEEWTTEITNEDDKWNFATPGANCTSYSSITEYSVEDLAKATVADLQAMPMTMFIKAQELIKEFMLSK